MPGPSPTPCPSDEELGLLLDGQLEGAALVRIREHVATCTSCALLAGVGATAEGAVLDPASGGDLRWMRGVVEKRMAGRIGHYEIIRPLGQGGMGEVYLARDTRLGRRVALKFLLEVDPSRSARFAVEARATAQLAHENIVAIHDIAEHEGVPYMVLEYVPGKTLEDWLRERRDDAQRSAGVPPERAAELMLPVARALRAAHRAGIVHRDLKPANVMLAESGTVKVLDFGIARLVGAVAEGALDAGAEPDDAPARDVGTTEALTETGAMVGTLAYMAPEQWHTGVVDGRADLWAAGIILYQLVTGDHPLAPLSPGALRSVARSDEPMPSLAERSPGIGKLGAIVDRCLLKRKDDRLGSAEELCEALEAIARPGTPRDEEDRNPYTGLAAFQERDAPRFFGREAMVEQIVARLVGEPLLSLLGPSGAGKSSLVRAGVIPALKRGGDAWEAWTLRPGPHPLGAIAELLLQRTWDRSSPSDRGEPPLPAPGDHEAMVERLRREPGLLGAEMRSHARRRRERALLFVDQFEEVYTLAPEAERDAFFACLAGAADDASSPLRVIVSLRHDFLDRVASSASALAELVSRGAVLVGPLDRRGLRSALIAPAEALSHRFEPEALAAEMLEALAGAASALPLLQFTAAKLWEGRDRERRLLTEQSYRAFGGVGGALASHADSVLAALGSAERRCARAVFLRLVTPERTRAIVTRRDLLEAGGATAADLDRVLDRLIEARLVTVEGAGRDESTIEVVHESLIATWPALGRWLEEEQGDAQLRARLRSAAKEWEASGDAEGLLWRGEAAEEARRWQARRGAEGAATLGAREGRYLAAVVALGERERRQRRQLVGAVMAGLSAVLLVVSVLAIQSKRAAERAEAERVEAERSATGARNAARMAAARARQGDPTTVLALLREIEPGSTPRGWAELAQWARGAGVSPVVLLHDDEVWDAAWSLDGRHLATASSDKAVRIWNADGSGQPLVLRGHEGGVWTVEYSPDGQRIVSASYDKTVRVWNADGSGQPLVLRGHEDSVRGAVWSPDGRRIASASIDRTVRVWNADGSGQPLVLRGHEDSVRGAAWSPDGRRIASGSYDKTVRVWNADGSGQPLVLRGHEAPVFGIAWSPDGRRIASASQDRTVRVWSADGSGEPFVFRGHDTVVFWVAWSPDGRRIASASQDRTVRVWSPDGSGQDLVLRGHDAAVFAVAWSADGRRLASTSWDKTVRVWSAGGSGQDLVLRGHDDVVDWAAWSPDGRRIVSVSDDKTVRVWNADGSGQPLVLRGHDKGLHTAAWSPDGRRIASSSDDKTVRVWDAGGSGQPLVLRGHDEAVLAVAWSPDGHRLASASEDHTLRVWSADGSGEPLVLRGHDLGVHMVAWSPDGHRLASASWDKTVRVWSADGSGQPLVLRGHDGVVNTAAWSPDGHRLASASDDKTVRVWNADGSGEPLVLRGHDAAVFSASWTPDGRILSASGDGTARLWSADGTGEPIVLRPPGEAVNSASVSPDGKRIVAASDDKTVIVWNDIEPLSGPDTPKLWTATAYCMPLDVRRRLLGFTEEQARADLARCQRGVAR